MKIPQAQIRTHFGKLLIIILVCNCFLAVSNPAQAQNRPIVITADQPNIWTLEQAHYLLAQMHRRNLDLRAKGLEALDANEINGLRFDVLKSLLEIGLNFNDADRVTNSLLLDNKKFNAERSQALLTRRDQLRAESIDVMRDISRLQTERASATDPTEQARLEAEITRRTALRDKLDKEVEFHDNEIKTVSAPTGDFKATTADVAFDPNKLPKGLLDDAFKDTTKKLLDKFNEEPKLNATLRLENYLQMQYEIIAKQLTLLRDEVGPGERLIFLELPQSINVTYNEANKKWAQSWWKIVGYTINKKKKALNASDASARRGSEPASGDESRSPSTTQTEGGYQTSTQEKNEPPIKTAQTYDATLRVNKPDRGSNDRQPDPRVKVESTFIDLDDISPMPALKEKLGDKLVNREIRTIDLIPRQSSLNVNDLKLQTRAGALTAVASFLFGFGARVNYQRQREQFAQFVQQELYSSAFGKGSREFGWTFTPMPGAERLMSGVRTTYAVIVVPENAASIVLETSGCYFPRSEYQPTSFAKTTDAKWTDNRSSRNCNDHKAFIVPIPGGGNDNEEFYVEKVYYKPVGKGERIVVSILGQDFSSQFGVLINGVPLSPALGLAQPFIRDDSATGKAVNDDIKNEKIRGRFERIDPSQVMVTFDMPPDFEGTPVITFVAPGKAIDLNRLPLIVNGVSTTLDNRNTDKMFAGPPRPSAKIDKVEVFRSNMTGNLTALITGAGFTSNQRVFVNGTDLGTRPYVSQSLLRAEFPTPLDGTIQITLVAGNETIKSQPVANPTHLKINNVIVVGYEAATKKSPGVLVIKIEGFGFTDALETDDGELTVQSPNEAILKIVNPDAAEVVTLKDRITGSEVRTIVTRKSRTK
jgi:hypothetical protein